MKIRNIAILLIFILAIVISFFIGTNFTTEPSTPDSTEIQNISAQLLSDTGNDLSLLYDATARLSDAIYITPGTDIQAVVDEADNPAIFVIGAGIHRLQNISPRDNDIFIGEEGAILNGSIVLDNFVAEDGYWINQSSVLSDYEPNIGGICRDTYERCNHPYDLYSDDSPLLHVATIDELTQDSWFFDYDNDRIYLGSDPAEHILELGTQFHAFEGDASEVVIQNLTIEKYSGFGQLGAIRAQDASRWIISNNTVRLNAAGGITFGNEMLILNNRVLQNGQIGISGQGENVVISGNEIAYNNYAGYDPAWEAGATKFVATDNLIVRNNYVHHNDGQGLWTDIGNINTLYEYNLVLSNTGAGIVHEISYEAIIRYNVVRYNFNEDVPVYSGAQIMISSSGNVDVYENDVVTGSEGGHAIVITQQDRGEGRAGAYESRNNHVYDNQIVFLNDNGETAAASDISDDDWFWEENVFEDNRYFGQEGNLALWGWQDTTLNWRDFSKQVETAGSYSTNIPLQAINSPAWQDIQSIANRNSGQ